MDAETLHKTFPRAPKACKQYANTFFACFSENSKKESTNDTQAGARGLAKCQRAKVLYEECMDKFTKNKPAKGYRVS